MKQNNPEKRTTLSLQEEIGRVYILPDNAQALGDREEQQDYFAYSDLFDMEQLIKYGGIAVLSDGMGGLNNGRDAAINAVNGFFQGYQASIDNGFNTTESINNGLYNANENVKNISQAGATLIGVVIKWNILSWISVGDSRLYLYRNGLLRQLNKEHIYAYELDEMVKNNVLSKEAALSNPERNALTSYLGLSTIELTDTNFDFQLFPGDIILLCSDGLYNSLTDNEISSILRNYSENIATKLIEEALSKEKTQQDNTTAVILKII